MKFVILLIGEVSVHLVAKLRFIFVRRSLHLLTPKSICLY